MITSSLRVPHRRGFTIMELSVALALLAVVMIIVAQLSYWSISNRLETAARHLALEHANNILEAARATPFEKLDNQWAADLGLPPDSQGYLPDGTLEVTVVPEPAVPGLKRVTVAISWDRRSGLPQDVVKLVALFAATKEAKK